MILEIDVSKTIKEQNLAFKQGYFHKVLSLIFKAVIISLPVFAIAYTIQDLLQGYKDYLEYLIVNVLALIACFVFFDSIRNSLKMEIIKGKNIEQNKAIVLECLEELQLYTVAESFNYLITHKGFYQKQVTIIFKGQDILINALHLSRGNEIQYKSSRMQNELKNNLEAKLKVKRYTTV